MSLFVEPSIAALEAAVEIRAPVVELHTTPAAGATRRTWAT
ncbi:pyridoxine 5'-phosphate synthase PdxJ [Rhodoblastus acidophilus]|nr:pyridoxine 5'-phosphate synthase PdxJ [Rhodoblastus acidophilus]